MYTQKKKQNLYCSTKMWFKQTPGHGHISHNQYELISPQTILDIGLVRASRGVNRSKKVSSKITLKQKIAPP